MSISEVSIRRPVFAWMLMAALILFGWISFQRMGISEMPNVDFPVVNISLRWDNAAPEVMELNVVDIIEDAVMGIEGLSSVTSSVSQGHANITCNFSLTRDINSALFDVQSRVQQASNTLPSSLYPPVISKTNPEDQPIMWIMVSADEGVPLYQQMIYARNTLQGQLSTILGVGNVMLAGYVEPNLRVTVDTKKMGAKQLTSSDIWSAIQQEQIEQPAGRIESPLQEMNVRVLGEAASVKDFSNIHINNRAGSPNYKPVLLKNIADIQEGLSDIRQISRFNGKTTVGLGIIKQHGSNAVEVSNAVHNKLNKIKAALLPGYHVDVHLDQTKFIKDSVNELKTTLLLAAFLTALICFFFLGSWSSTFNVLLAIPTSIIGTFTALYFFGFTLNTFTLLGLGLAIGIVVDDAIMMLENIVRHYEMGKTRRQASLDGSKEITFAAIATTLSIAAIFIPVVFMQGMVGRFFYQYGITVAVAVFLSLLEALTLTPMRCARFMTSAKIDGTNFLSRTMDHLMEWVETQYRRSLDFVLHHRILIVVFSLLFFSGSLYTLKFLRTEMIPHQDQSMFLVTLRTKVGTSIQATDEVFKKAEGFLKSQSEIRDVYTTIGNYQNNNVVNTGTLYIILQDPKDRKITQNQLMQRIRKELRTQFPDTQVFAQDLSLAGFSASRGFPIEFTVEGPEWKRIQELATRIITRMNQSGFFEDINTDAADGMPTIHILPDRAHAADHGVSMTTIGQEVGYLMGGQIFDANTQYPKDGHRYDIRLRSQESQHEDMKDLKSITLRNNRGSTGELIPLEKATHLEETTGFQLITRSNRARAIPIFANLTEGKSQQTALSVITAIAKEELPAGYSARMTGSATAFGEAFSSLIFALLFGILVAYMILASQFNSFIHPITVLTALPFSLSGALIALYFFNQSLSLFSMIGVILLMGIAKKNSILLVDFTNQCREVGSPLRQALLEACPIRLRPILMTSFATIAGALPAALNWGPGAETRVPMAIAIIGGVMVSTLLTLYVVPCVYSLFSRFEKIEATDTEEAAAMESV